MSYESTLEEVRAIAEGKKVVIPTKRAPSFHKTLAFPTLATKSAREFYKGAVDYCAAKEIIKLDTGPRFEPGSRQATGSQGGKLSKAAATPEERHEAAKRAAAARWGKAE